MPKIPLVVSSGCAPGTLIDTDIEPDLLFEHWLGAPNREFREVLRFRPPLSWIRIQRPHVHASQDRAEVQAVDWASSATLLPLEDVEQWFDRAHLKRPQDLIDACKQVEPLARVGVPPIEAKKQGTRERIAALIGELSFGCDAPEDVLDAIVTLLVAGIFLVDGEQGLKDRERASVPCGYDAVDAAMLARLLTRAAAEHPTLALLTPLFPGGLLDTTAAPAASELVAVLKVVAVARAKNESALPCANKEAAAALLGFVAQQLESRWKRAARSEAEAAGQSKTVYRQALRLHEMAMQENPDIRNTKGSFVWLKRHPTYHRDMSGGKASWSLTTFQRYVREARKLENGPRPKLCPGELRSATSPWG